MPRRRRPLLEVLEVYEEGGARVEGERDMGEGVSEFGVFFAQEAKVLICLSGEPGLLSV